MIHLALYFVPSLVYPRCSCEFEKIFCNKKMKKNEKVFIPTGLDASRPIGN